MTSQITAWKPNQIVSEARLTDLWNSLFFDHSLQNADREIPAIIEGLEVSINENTGLATVQPGVFLGEAFTSADEADISGDIYPFSKLNSATQISVTSVGEEYGYIVATQTLDPQDDIQEPATLITGAYNVDVALNYRAGNATDYPDKILHDTILAGVYTTPGGMYILYFGEGTTPGGTQKLRAEDKKDYYQTIRQRDLSADPNFYPWINSGGTPVNQIGNGTKQITSIWDLQLYGGTAQNVTASTVSFTDANVPLTGSTGTTYLKLVNSVASGLGGVRLYQTQDDLSKFANQWATVYAVVKLVSVTTSLSVQPVLNFNDQVNYPGEETALSTSTEFQIINLGSIYFETQKIRDTATPFTNPVDIRQRLEIISDGTYDLEIYGVYFVNGRGADIPQTALIDQRSINAATLALKEEIDTQYSANGGAALIGTASGDTVQQELNDLTDNFGGLKTVAYARTNNAVALINSGLTFTKGGVGSYDFTFSPAQPDTNFIIHALAIDGSAGQKFTSINNPTTTSFKIEVWNVNPDPQNADGVYVEVKRKI